MSADVASRYAWRTAGLELLSAVVSQSDHTRRERSAADRFTLFRVHYSPDRPRVAADHVRISPMQVMQRAEGPYLDDISLGVRIIDFNKSGVAACLPSPSIARMRRG